MTILKTKGQPASPADLAAAGFDMTRWQDIRVGHGHWGPSDQTPCTFTYKQDEPMTRSEQFLAQAMQRKKNSR